MKHTPGPVRPSALLLLLSTTRADRKPELDAHVSGTVWVRDPPSRVNRLPK
jgi:hypothetical protein